LAIEDRGAWIWLAFGMLTHTLPQLRVEPFLGSIFAPLAVVVVHTVVVWIFTWQILLLTARAHHIEYRVEDLQIQFDGTTWSLALGIHKWLKNSPLLVGQITGIKFGSVRQ
jgi:hypothetical protein